jgi:BRCT domain type II-containing protein
MNGEMQDLAGQETLPTQPNGRASKMSKHSSHKQLSKGKSSQHDSNHTLGNIVDTNIVNNNQFYLSPISNRNSSEDFNSL